jgi:acetyltransferase-like isoleucine patch superfamily enzyme
MSVVGNLLARFHKPFMVYGYFDHESKRFQKYTRISSTATIMNRKALNLGDHVWVWHHTILDATEGLMIGEGTQIGAWVGIFTHGSEKAIRLLGNEFVHIDNEQRIGYTRGSVKIGSYTFVGAKSVILPGVEIGKGCLIGTGTLVTKDVPDYSIVVGSPGKIIGSTMDLDREFISEYEELHKTYYDEEALRQILDAINDKDSG